MGGGVGGGVGKCERRKESGRRGWGRVAERRVSPGQIANCDFGFDDGIVALHNTNMRSAPPLKSLPPPPHPLLFPAGMSIKTITTADHQHNRDPYPWGVGDERHGVVGVAV